MGKARLTYDYVKNFIEELGYELISDEYINNSTNLIFKDKNGYYYFCLFCNIQRGQQPAKFNKSNPYTIQNIKNWCVLNNKEFELISDEYICADGLLKWRCLKETCGEIFESRWADISTHRGCGYCRGLKIGESNSLANKNPQLAKEWHPIRNGNFTPEMVASASNKRVWWMCENNHEWEAVINDRNAGNECPYCSGRFATTESNLLISNPKLCEEWNYEKNKASPENYKPYSHYKVWWKCAVCGEEWKARISDRHSNKSIGCNDCNNPKGEVRINDFFKIHKIYNEPQKEFHGLVGLRNGNLSYDFYLPDYNLLIEYQGQFHDGSTGGYSRINLKAQQEHDCRKREYAQRHNIRLLEIWYWDFDNIEDILVKELNLSKL